MLLSHCSVLYTQDRPKVILKDSTELRLSKLDVQVKVIGNFVETTYDMKFYNETDRTLEGELVFPLGEGQSVAKFSMDVNGKLRDAVVVEKELARRAYENTVRQQIDPGLLEQTQGNNYKARIYPILPQSYKHLVITYEQELHTSKGLQTFEIPLGLKEKLDVFNVTIELFNTKGVPSIKNNTFRNFYFKEKEQGQIASLKLKNTKAENPIVVQIQHPESSARVLTHNNIFYIYKNLEPKLELKEKPQKITLLWDASYSQRHRKIDDEIKLLDTYFDYLKDVDVQFIAFSNTVIKIKP